MAVQTITFQNCLNPGTYQDFDVDTSIILSGHTIFADYECWESTGNVGGGPSGTVIFTGYTTCAQCNNDFNGWEFEHCTIPGTFVYFGLKNSEVNQYFETTGATIFYDGTCYNYTGVYEQGTGSTTYNYTISELISTNSLFTDCNSCLTPPSPTPTPTPSTTPALCYSGITDSPSWYYTDCCGVYHSGSFTPTYICYDPNYPTSGVSVSASPCSVVCPSVTPTPTPTLTQTPSETPSVTPTPTNTVTPTKTPSLTPTNTVTPTNTPTNTPSSTLGSTPSVTPTNTPSLTPSSTPTSTPTNTPSLTPSVTVSVTPTVTPSPSLISTGCTQYTFSLHPIYFLTQAGPYNISGTTTGGTIVLIATGVTTSQLLSGYTALVCYSISTFTVQSNGTCTNSVNFTLPVPISSPTPTPTKTPTPSPSGNPAVTPSVTPTNTPTNTVTPTVTETPTVTPTKTPTVTPTKTVTPTPSSTYKTFNMVGCTSYCSGVVLCSGSYSITLYTLPNVTNIYDPGVIIYTNNTLTTTFDGFIQIGSIIYEIVSGSVTTQYTIGDGC